MEGPLPTHTYSYSCHHHIHIFMSSSYSCHQHLHFHLHFHIIFSTKSPPPTLSIIVSISLRGIIVSISLGVTAYLDASMHLDVAHRLVILSSAVPLLTVGVGISGNLDWLLVLGKSLLGGGWSTGQSSILLDSSKRQPHGAQGLDGLVGLPEEKEFKWRND